MKNKQIHGTGEKARIRAGVLLVFALGCAEIHMLCQHRLYHRHAAELGENSAPVPRQDVYLPPW
jgi:hypothetical protein